MKTDNLEEFIIPRGEINKWKDLFAKAWIEGFIEKNEDGRYIVVIGNKYLDLDKYIQVDSFIKRRIDELREPLLRDEEGYLNEEEFVFDRIMRLFFIKNSVLRITDDRLFLSEVKTEKKWIKSWFEKRESVAFLEEFSKIKRFKTELSAELLIKENFGIEAEEQLAENLNKKIKKFTLELAKEGIIKEEMLISSGFFENVDSNELVSFYKEGIVSANMLVEVGFFDDMSIEQLKQLHEDNVFTNRDIVTFSDYGVISSGETKELLGGAQGVAKLYKSAAKKRNTKEANKFFNILEQEEICLLYSDGIIDLEDLKKAKVDLKTIQQLPEDVFIKIIQKGLPNEMSIEENELLSEYITKYSGDTIIELAKCGYIGNEKLLDLLDIQVGQENADRALNGEKLLSIYTPSEIAKLMQEGKINIGFVKKLNESVIANLDDEQNSEYMQSLTDECKKLMDEETFAQNMLELMDNNIVHKQVLDISENILENMLLNEMLTEDKAIEFFNEGVLNNTVIGLVFGTRYDEIIESVKEGKLSDRAYLNLPKKTVQDSLEIGMLEVADVFDIYSKYDGLSVEELSVIFDEYGNIVEQRINVTNLINQEFDNSKIRELFLYNVLSHQDLYELESKGVITEEQRKEIEKMDIAKEFKKLFDAPEKSLENMRDTIKIPQDPTGYNPNHNTKIPEISPVARFDFLVELGAYGCKEVSPIDSHGKASFGGYTAFGFLDSGLIVLENLQKPRNATYIMTLQEFKSHITKQTEDKIVFTLGKQALRKDMEKRGKAFSFRNHRSEWGRNVISDMESLSNYNDGKVNPEEKERLALWMKEEYEKSRLEVLGTDDLLADELRGAKFDRNVALEELQDIQNREDVVKPDVNNKLPGDEFGDDSGAEISDD